MTTSITLKSVSEIQASINTISNESVAYSFLFHALVKGNVSAFTGMDKKLVQRLVGSKLFRFVPMRDQDKEGVKGKVYSYNQKGSLKMLEELDKAKKASITELLDLQFHAGDDYFETFVDKITNFLLIEADKKAKASKASKAEELTKLNDEFNAYSSANPEKGIDKDTFKQVKENFMTLQTAVTQLASLCKDKAIVEQLKAYLASEKAIVFPTAKVQG